MFRVLFIWDTYETFLNFQIKNHQLWAKRLLQTVITHYCWFSKGSTELSRLKKTIIMKLEVINHRYAAGYPYRRSSVWIKIDWTNLKKNLPSFFLTIGQSFGTRSSRRVSSQRSSKIALDFWTWTRTENLDHKMGALWLLVISRKC